jgi:hypothetical protein
VTIRERVETFLRKCSPRAICDACVGDHLGLTMRQVCRVACYLASQGRVNRYKGQCGGCCARKAVTVSSCLV